VNFHYKSNNWVTIKYQYRRTHVAKVAPQPERRVRVVRLRYMIGETSLACPTMAVHSASAMSSPYSIRDALREHFAPVVRNAGFAGSGSTFRRIDGGLVQVSNIQGSSYGGMFYMNLGIHPIAGFAGDPRKINVNKCLLRRRLVDDSMRDGWRYGDNPASMIEAATSAARVFTGKALSLFAQQSGPNAPIFSITMDKIGREEEYSGFYVSLWTIAPIMKDLRR